MKSTVPSIVATACLAEPVCLPVELHTQGPITPPRVPAPTMKTAAQLGIKSATSGNEVLSRLVLSACTACWTHSLRFWKAMRIKMRLWAGLCGCVHTPQGKRSFVCLLAMSLATGFVSAQTTYRASLTGGAEAPPNASTGTGISIVALNAAQNQITVDLTWNGLSANATAAHIHGPAGVGTNAAVIFALTGVTSTPSGTVPQQTFSITPTQLGHLRSGLLYINVHTTTYPGGEVRGQLVPVTVYRASLTGGAEAPPNASTGTGISIVALNTAQTKITVDLTWSGLNANATAAHIHGPAGVGTNAAVIFSLTGVTGTPSGTVQQQTFSITPTQLGHLQSGLLYINVHTTSYPGGEVRGQLFPSPVVGIGLAAQIAWWASAGFHYQVQGASVLNSNVWLNLGPALAGNNAMNYYYDPFGTHQSRFYRVVTQP